MTPALFCWCRCPGNLMIFSSHGLGWTSPPPSPPSQLHPLLSFWLPAAADRVSVSIPRSRLVLSVGVGCRSCLLAWLVGLGSTLPPRPCISSSTKRLRRVKNWDVVNSSQSSRRRQSGLPSPRESRRTSSTPLLTSRSSAAMRGGPQRPHIVRRGEEEL